MVGQLPPWSLDLRRWQEQAYVKFFRSEHPNFLSVATPAAGKTRFGLRIAHQMLSTGEAQYVVIVVPTSHLKEQWAGTDARSGATQVGIHLDPAWSNQLNGMIGSEYHGVVVTYQQVAANPEIFRSFCSRFRVFVIFDEIHHAADEKAWGTALYTAFSLAVKRLLLSGTPFRSDGNPIPFVTYEHNRCKADDNYTYEMALDDQDVVRHVWFPSWEGRMDWLSGGKYYSAVFADAIAEQRQNERLRAAIGIESEWLKAVIIEADRKLQEIRMEHLDAGGLVIARDQYHARDVQRLIKKLTGREAMIAISDDPDASETIRAFTGNTTHWLVQVKMVSEGVDIPRLRVAVYATVTATEQFFRQAVGRLMRWVRSAGETQDAYFYIPADPRLLAFARAIMDERDHQLAEVMKRLKREAGDLWQAGDDTRGQFIPIAVTDVRADAIVTGDVLITPANIAYTKLIMDQADVQGSVEHMAKVLYLAGVFKGNQSVAAGPEREDNLTPDQQPMYVILKQVKKQVRKRVTSLHLATNQAMSYAQIFVKLKAGDGVEHAQATIDQHLARMAILDQWIAEAKYGR